MFCTLLRFLNCATEVIRATKGRKYFPLGPHTGQHCSRGKIYGETEREDSVGREKDEEGKRARRMRCKGRKKKKTLMQHKRRKAVLFYSE
jgi:hypothetical protein